MRASSGGLACPSPLPHFGDPVWRRAPWVRQDDSGPPLGPGASARRPFHTDRRKTIPLLIRRHINRAVVLFCRRTAWACFLLPSWNPARPSFKVFLPVPVRQRSAVFSLPCGRDMTGRCVMGDKRQWKAADVALFSRTPVFSGPANPSGGRVFLDWSPPKPGEIRSGQRRTPKGSSRRRRIPPIGRHQPPAGRGSKARNG